MCICLCVCLSVCLSVWDRAQLERFLLVESEWEKGEVRGASGDRRGRERERKEGEREEGERGGRERREREKEEERKRPEVGGGQGPPFKRGPSECAQGVLLVAAAEDPSCQDLKGSQCRCLHTNTQRPACLPACMSLCVCLPACLSACVCVCLPVSVCLPVCLSACVCIFVGVRGWCVGIGQRSTPDILLQFHLPCFPDKVCQWHGTHQVGLCNVESPRDPPISASPVLTSQACATIPHHK